MLIIVRIPTEAYAYQEVHFDSLEEYKKEMPNFVREYALMKKQLKKQQELQEVPFEQ